EQGVDVVEDPGEVHGGPQEDPRDHGDNPEAYGQQEGDFEDRPGVDLGHDELRAAGFGFRRWTNEAFASASFRFAFASRLASTLGGFGGLSLTHYAPSSFRSVSEDT